MQKRISSWVLFWVMCVGVMILMIGQRPSLQARGQQDGPGPTIRIAGHSLTWTAAAALTVRMARSTRASLRDEAAQRQREFEAAQTRTAQRPPEPRESDQV